MAPSSQVNIFGQLMILLQLHLALPLHKSKGTSFAVILLSCQILTRSWMPRNNIGDGRERFSQISLQGRFLIFTGAEDLIFVFVLIGGFELEVGLLHLVYVHI